MDLNSTSNFTANLNFNPSLVVNELMPFLKTAMAEHTVQILNQGTCLTREETAERLGITLSTLDRYTKAGMLTKYRLGSSDTVRYKSAEVDLALKPIKYTA